MAWPALSTVTVDDWVIKLGGGVSRRSNSANPLSARSVLTGSVIDRAEAIYAGAGQPAFIRIPSFLDDRADALLSARGYGTEGESLTLTAPLAPAQHGEADLAPAPGPEWLAASNRINGRSAQGAAAFDEIVGRVAVPCAFASAVREDRIVAVAYGALDRGWLCVEAVATDAAWRGQGLARSCVGSLMGWAARRGAVAAGLQVQADNRAAQSVYRRLGFAREFYRYRYRRAP